MIDYSKWSRYRVKDKARLLFVEHDYSIKELENKFNRKMSVYYIPQWMRDKKEAHQIAKQQREAKALALSQKIRRQREKALRLEEKERRYRLRKNEVKKVKAISKKIREFDLVSVAKNIKRCPANQFNMRSL